MAINKQLFINAIKLAEVGGHTVIPTAVYYDATKTLIGNDALAAEIASQPAHDNFKLALGAIDPRALSRDQVAVRPGQWRSAVGLTKDFVDTSLDKVRDWMNREHLRPATRILVAEPIAMGAAEDVPSDWLANYRAHLRRILEGRGQFEDVEFLPEPFAVFQYYRYGLRHPLIAGEQRHVALVVDFGGGTFDVSVVETTAKGDISQSGRNSKPLSAASVPVGGAFINREIARTLVQENLAKGTDRQRVDYAIKKYEEVVHGHDIRSEDLKDDLQQFFGHFRRLLSTVEKAKLSLCRRIDDWALTAEYPLDLAVELNVPTNPLRRDPEFASARFSAYDFRQLFERNVWKSKLRSTLVNAVTRAGEALQQQPIRIALLSGGSANIRWLKHLLERDLAQELPEVKVLELQGNFQEIVAKGLAIECARRTHQDGGGDFGAITYNPLHLYAAPNGGEREEPQYKPVTEQLPAPQTPGVLLPSASVLARYVGRPMCWKFRLSHAPKNFLDYYFTRGNWNDDDQYHAQNIDHRVQTPRDVGFGANIWVEITIREDGTTCPRFIYQREGRGIPGRSVEARPFALDMTSLGSSGACDAYVGFDFGSTNSSYSFIARTDIDTFDNRSKDKDWLELNELLPLLPYPVANPMKRYIAETRSELLERRGLEAVEAALMYVAFASYAEMRDVGDRKATYIFKALQHRSAGPLWRLFRDAQTRLGSRARFTRELGILLKETNYALIDGAVDQLANFKHGKKATVDYRRVLATLGNAIRRSLASCVFGGFEDVRKRGFGRPFSGHFRIAHGPDRPFVDVLDYEGQESFAQEELYLLDKANGIGLPLTPLMLWHAHGHSGDSDEIDLYVYDSADSKSGNSAFSFKATASKDVVVASNSGGLRELAEALEVLRREDSNCPALSGLAVVDREQGAI